MTTAETAKALAERGFAVFPLNKEGQPRTKNGFKDASLDPFAVHDVFTESDAPLIGVATGVSGIVVLDLDVKDGKDGFDSLDKAWLDIPDTYAYPSRSGKGRHFWYGAPEGKSLPRKMTYRGMAGVDRCSGEGYVIWAGDEVPAREDLAAPPEWLLDETQTRDYSEFTGEIAEWYEGLEPGAPNAPVRKAMERAKKLFASRGDDFSHSDIVERQHEAVRLGAEGHPGVTELLALLEELTLERTGAHSRDPEEYEAEFREALVSGIRKAGAVTDLRGRLPEYSLKNVPESVPSSLVVRDSPGDKSDVMNLVRTLAESGVDDMRALSIVWGSPVTRDLARDWGLEFVHDLITDARKRVDTPDEAVPVRDEPEEKRDQEKRVSLLTDKERGRAQEADTFVDFFTRASKLANGFVQPAYTVPLAWSVLSLGAGLQGVIPKAGGFGTNLWFAVLGASGSGKSMSVNFARDVADSFLVGPETYWNTGAGSPEGIEEALVRRDGRVSAMLEDEAGAFYKNLLTKDWMQTLSNRMADWYGGKAMAPQKVRLAELRGKKADISFNYFTISTPDDTLKVIDEEMFATGFMARIAWVLGPEPSQSDERYRAVRSDLTKSGKSVQSQEIGYDMSLFGRLFPADQKTEIWGSDSAISRAEKAYKAMDKNAKKHPKYDQIIQPSVVRLDQTMWKCAALLAMYRGSDEFDKDDVLIALSYVEEWYQTVLHISERVDGLYQRDAKAMVDFIREQGGTVPRRNLVRQFGHLISRTSKELADRIDFILDAGYTRAEMQDGKTVIVLNE